MAEYGSDLGSNSALDQPSPDKERAIEEPKSSEGKERLTSKQITENCDNRKLNGEVVNVDNEIDKNTSGTEVDFGINNDLNLDFEEKYNREVLGAETYTSLDDLLASNQESLIDTDVDFIHRSPNSVNLNVIKHVKVENTNLPIVNELNESKENVDSVITVTFSGENIVKNGITEEKVNTGGHELNEVLVTQSQASLKMPETREETEGCISPSLMFAVCRYRWEKTIVTQSDSVVFVTLNNKEIEPIKLGWDQNSKCFYSEEFKIPTGKYLGNLVVDGVFYPVEDITVKHYTFEVDLYLKDDIIEDEGDKTGINKAEQFLQQKQNGANIDITPNTGVRTSSGKYTDSRARMEEEQTQDMNRDGSIHVSSKYEDLVRTQMSHSKSALDTQTDIFDNLDLAHLDGRRSPVGDDGGKEYQDGDARNEDLDAPQVYQMAPMNGDSTLRKEYVIDSVIHDDLEAIGRTGNVSVTTSDQTAAQAVIDDIFGSGHTRSPVYSTETPVHSKNGSAHSSTRQTPVTAETQDFMREPVRSDSLERRLLDNLIDDSLNREKSPTQIYSGSKSDSQRSTPQPEQIADVLNPADRHSPIRREYLAGSPRTSDHGSQRGSEQGSVPGSTHSSQRQTPQKDIINDSLRASHEKLYTTTVTNFGHDFKRSAEKLNGSLSGGSNHGSRPQSLTSEQELTQYYELNSAGGSPGLPPVATGSGGQGQRTSSASSLPVVGGNAQRQYVERRSMTPDNHIRVPITGPIIKSSLLPTRGAQRATPGSNTSSRTVTPVNAVTDTQETARLQERILDLEQTLSNVRTLLASREKEVFQLKGNLQEIKDINRQLQEELDQRRARTSPGLQIAELERQYREVVNERETLSAEVVRLREENMRKDEERNSLNSYDPNGPQALQRKIDDLNSQIQDLQEANESAVEEIKAAENRIKQLAGENETLRATQASSMRDLEDDNRHLKHELSRLKEQTSHTEVNDYRLKIELQQIKEDNRGLRERNYTLHDENIKLKEELDALKKSLEALENSRRTYQEERHSSRNVENYATHEPRLKPLDGRYHSEHGEREYKTSAYAAELKQDYKTSEYAAELKRDVEREREREKHIYSYTSPGYDSKSRYELKEERIRTEKSYKDEKYSSLETSSRYDSHRSVPDGRSTEKLPTRSQYEPRPLTPERPSALGPAKRDYYSSSQPLDRKKTDRLATEDSVRTRRERARTSSAELDFRSAPLSTFSEGSKTMPALSGRSRAIYKSLSDLRARSRSRSPSNRLSNHTSNRPIQYRESPASSHVNQKYSKTLSQSSKIYIENHLNTNKWNDETRLRIAPDHGSSGYVRGTAAASASRKLGEPYTREDKGLDHRPAVPYQDDGDVSDTATDILVNAQPLENLPSAAWTRTRPRRGSVGSDGSDLSFGDIDDQLVAATRKRSKSADGREVLRRMNPPGILSRSGPTTPVKGDTTPSSNAGFRSITPQPLATQRNKTQLALSPVTLSLTHGLRPFAPRSAGDLQVSDVIKFSRQGGKLSQGTIKFIGHLPGRGDIYLGVELDKEDGKHDGTFEDIRYFKCKPNKGVFVAYNKVVMAWTA